MSGQRTTCSGSLGGTTLLGAGNLILQREHGALEEFTTERMVARTLETYRALLGEGGAREGSQR